MTAPNRDAPQPSAERQWAYFEDETKDAVAKISMWVAGGGVEFTARDAELVLDALEAAQPSPRQGDEERARDIAEKRYRDDETIGWLTNAIVRFAAAVRAEATLAEREACAKVADDFAPKFRENGHAMRNVIERGLAIAAAIRARKQ